MALIEPWREGGKKPVKDGEKKERKDVGANNERDAGAARTVALPLFFRLAMIHGHAAAIAFHLLRLRHGRYGDGHGPDVRC